MLANQKPTGRTMTMPGGMAVGVLLGLCLTVLLSALLAKLVDMEVITEDQIGYGSIILLLLSSGGASTAAFAKIRRRRLPVFALTGVIYLLSLLALAALFFGGQIHGVGPTALVVMSGSMVTFLLSGRGKGSGGRRNKRRRNR